MKIPNSIVRNYPISYNNEEYFFYFIKSKTVEEIIYFLPPTSKKMFYYEKNMFYSDDSNKTISGTFIIGKLGENSNKFPYPFLLDCNQPILIEVTDSKIIKQLTLTLLIQRILKDFKATDDSQKKNIYNELCKVYGAELLDEILSYEDIIYYFN